jgi:DNA-binding NtrC family response regulator
MRKEFEAFSLHQKMQILVKELVDEELPIKDALKEFEKIYIQAASNKYNGNKTKMAKGLGIHRNTLHNLMKALKLD